MQNIRRYAGVLGLFVFASIILIAGCNNPTPVEPVYPTAALATQESPCLTFDQICATISNQLENLCPRARAYKNWGDENSCVKTTIAQLLDSYKDCLSGEQLSDVRECVYQELSSRNIGDNKGPDIQQE
jgi:hypothetical protein